MKHIRYINYSHNVLSHIQGCVGGKAINVNTAGAIDCSISSRQLLQTVTQCINLIAE